MIFFEKKTKKVKKMAIFEPEQMVTRNLRAAAYIMNT